MTTTPCTAADTPSTTPTTQRGCGCPQTFRPVAGVPEQARHLGISYDLEHPVYQVFAEDFCRQVRSLGIARFPHAAHSDGGLITLPDAYGPTWAHLEIVTNSPAEKDVICAAARIAAATAAAYGPTCR